MRLECFGEAEIVDRKNGFALQFYGQTSVVGSLPTRQNMPTRAKFS